jgi:hypothetical protein
VAGSPEAIIGRCSVNVVPHARQRNSYNGTRPVYAGCRTG